MSNPRTLPTTNRAPSLPFSILNAGMDSLELRYRNPIPTGSAALSEIFDSGKSLSAKRRLLHGTLDKTAVGVDWTPTEFSSWLMLNPAMMHPRGSMFFLDTAPLRLAEHGIWVPQEETVARMDLAVDIEFRSFDDAQVALEALAALHVPRLRISPEHATGSPALETVAWVGGGKKRRIKLRVYDRDAKAGKATTRGPRVLRFERQDRRCSRDQLSLASYLEVDHTKTITSPICRSYGERVLVADARGLYREISRMHEAAEIRGAVADRMRRAVAKLNRAGTDLEPTPSIPRKDIDDFRTRGLAFSPTRNVPVDLTPLLAAVRQAWGALSAFG